MEGVFADDMVVDYDAEVSRAGGAVQSVAAGA